MVYCTEQKIINELLKILTPCELKHFDYIPVPFVKDNVLIGVACYRIHKNFNGETELNIGFITSKKAGFLTIVNNYFNDMAKNINATKMIISVKNDNIPLQKLAVLQGFNPTDIFYEKKVI